MKYFTILIFFLLLFFTLLNAQVSTFRNINNGDGLLDWQANCFLKDQKGFVWIGGNYSVNQFDGRHIKQYVFPENISRVNALEASKKGDIYAATSNGLFKKESNKTSFSRIYPKHINSNVLSLYIDSVNTMYVGTPIGLAIVSPDSVVYIQIENKDFPFNKVIEIYKSNNNLIWLLTPGGPASYNTVTGSVMTYPYNQKETPSFFTCMTRTDSVLYIGSKNSGIYSFNTHTGITTPFMRVGNNAITCITADQNAQLYIGTVGTGVFVISMANRNIILSFDSSPHSHEKLTSSMVSTLMFDNLGILWIGNFEALGFDYMYIQPKAFNLFRTSSFSTHNLPVHGLYLGNGFKLLTNSYGIFYVSDNTGMPHFFENGVGKATFLKPGDVFSFIFYSNKIIVGGENGIYSLDPESIKLEVFEPLAFLLENTVFHLNVDSKGNLWVASNAGLHILDNQTGKIRSYNTLNSQLIDNIIRYTFFDSKGRVWICTEKGMCFWNETEKKFINEGFPEDFINNQNVHYITEDRKGNLLFCYNERNVLFAKPDLNSFKQICTEIDADFTGLRILKVLQDSTGAFWFIGSRGTIRANEELTNFALFSTTEGIMEPYATDGRFDKEGNLWLATNKGLFYSKFPIKRTVAPIAITDVKINGISKIYELAPSLEGGNRIVLDRNSNNLEFQFALLTFDRPDLMVYECKLIGFEKDWQFLRGLNTINYNDLKPGKYTFLVRRNMDHTCYSEVHFKIKPFISRGKIVIALIILVFSIFLFRFFFTRMNIKSTRLLKHSVKEEKYRFNKISEDEAHIIIQKLNKYMVERKPYLQESLKMADLAKETGCSSQTLSQVFNVFMNQKYYDFINWYRVDEFKRIISSTDYSRYTLKAMAKNSGFTSYTSFYRAFKEQTGITPNEYIQQFELDQS